MKRKKSIFIAAGLLVASSTFVYVIRAQNHGINKQTITTVEDTSGLPSSVPSLVPSSTSTIQTNPLDATDIAKYLPSMDAMQTWMSGRGGDFVVASDEQIPNNPDTFTWAQNLTFGHERVLGFKSVNESNPMKIHDARVVLRTFVFATSQDADTAIKKYMTAMGTAVEQKGSKCGKWFATLRYEARLDELSQISEAMIQDGSVVISVVYQDSGSWDWTTNALQNADDTARAILREHPLLSVQEPMPRGYIPPSYFSTFFPRPDYINGFAEELGGSFEKIDERDFPAGTSMFTWADTILSGYERTLELTTKDDPTAMATSSARAIIRALVFESSAGAAAAAQQYEKTKGKSLVRTDTEQDLNTGSEERISIFEYNDPSNQRNHIQETMRQQGALITWAIIEDSSTFDWSAATWNITAQYAQPLFAASALLAC